MTYLEILPKWITLSRRKAFTQEIAGVPVYTEVMTAKKTNRTSSEETPQIGCELRIDGPYCSPLGTMFEYEALVEVNIGCTLAHNEQDSTMMEKLTGKVTSVLNAGFCVYRLGDTVYDTGARFEKLQLVSEDRIDISNFGQIDVVNKIYQSTVEAHYKMRFTDGTI